MMREHPREWHLLTAEELLLPFIHTEDEAKNLPLNSNCRIKRLESALDKSNFMALICLESRKGNAAKRNTMHCVGFSLPFVEMTLTAFTLQLSTFLLRFLQDQRKLVSLLSREENTRLKVSNAESHGFLG